MFWNYLKMAWRNLLRNKFTSFINITGLSAGMAVAILIGLWINDELGFNSHFRNYNRIAQVMQNRTVNGETMTSDMIPLPLASTLSTDYRQKFKYVVLASGTWQHILNTGSLQLLMNGNFMQSPAPEMLSLTMLHGTRAALQDHSSILLTQSSAKALFGNEDAEGKILKLDNKLAVKITGVYEDLPANTSFSNLAFIASWDIYAALDPNIIKSAADWGNNSYDLYVQLQDHADLTQLSAQIKDVKLKQVDASSAKFKPEIFLQPMDRWHLYSEFKNGINTGGAISYVWMFGMVGVFVLLLACINFMNLSTARSEKRAREVGVRKSIGSVRGQLVLQFFTESTMLAFLSFSMAIVIVNFALPAFNTIAAKDITISWDHPAFWLAGITFSLAVGLLAGSYPAFYLSSFNPVAVLKGTFRAGKWAALPRRILVVLQFSVSIILIIGTLVIFQQLRYSQNRQVGYNREGLIFLEMNSGVIHDHFQSFRNDMLNTGAVVELAESGSPITGIYNLAGGMKWAGKDPAFADEFALIGTSMQFGKTVGWKLSQGRDFSMAYPSDSTALILNQAAVSYMNLKDPLGAIIDWWGKKYHVIGVTENMVMQSPYAPAKQTLFFVSRDAGNFLSIRLNPKQNIQSALERITSVWKNYSPNEPFDFNFADQEYQKKFQAEQKVGTLSSVFSAIAILISCLGLFGMALFMAERRTKELGVRKVLGASVFNLWLLLCRDFIVLVVVAMLIAMPIAGLCMHYWLQNYSYHTALSVWVFALTGLSALGVSIITVSYQSIRAALMNPVLSLKTE